MERSVAEQVDGLVGAVLDGRYQVGPVLARGGMSTVYGGTDTRLDRPVAIKVMAPGFAGDPIFLQRFEREARAAARLHHPGVVGVYDQGIDRSPTGDHVFLVMELVPGGTLRDLLRERAVLPVPLALSVAEPVLSALATAHREGLVHRDVKPENVLIGPGGVVKVADFGLVRAIAESSTTTGNVILGTVAYLSPEQVATGAADARSDVYAAGVLLFELLTGRPPYTGDTALSVAYRHVNDDVPPPSSRAPGLPARLDELVVSATRRDPAARPADASEFLLALQRVRSELAIPRERVPVPVRPQFVTTVGRPSPPMTAADAEPNHTRAMTRTDLPRSTVAPARPLLPRRDEGAYRRQRARSRRAFLSWLTVVLLLATAAGTAAWWLGVGRWTPVPAVAGLERAAAEAVLAESDLGVEIVEDHHDSMPPERVIGTDPAAGDRAIRGSDIGLILSLGPPVVPDLPEGTSAEDAEQIVTEADLRPVTNTVDAEYSDTVPEGAVVGLRPAPGTVLTVGAVVRLVLSRGPAPTTVPDVRTRSEADATAVLAGAGLTVERVERRFDERIPGGQVIGTEPRAGAEATRGTEITLLVSTALVVPDVVGQGRDKALATLSDAGFAPQETGQGAGEPDARVVSVDPAPGSLVNPTDRRIAVEMTTKITVPEVTGRTVAEARQVLADVGLRVEVQRFFGGESSRVIAQSPSAGDVVEPGSTVRLITP